MQAGTATPYVYGFCGAFELWSSGLQGKRFFQAISPASHPSPTRLFVTLSQLPTCKCGHPQRLDPRFPALHSICLAARLLKTDIYVRIASFLKPYPSFRTTGESNFMCPRQVLFHCLFYLLIFFFQARLHVAQTSLELLILLVSNAGIPDLRHPTSLLLSLFYVCVGMCVCVCSNVHTCMRRPGDDFVVPLDQWFSAFLLL